MQNKVSLKVIIDRVLRNPLLSDLSLEAAIDYTVEVIGLIGSPFMFEHKVTRKVIQDNRAVLPCDLVELKQVRVTTIKNLVTGCACNENGELPEIDYPVHYEVVRHSSDTFHERFKDRCGNKKEGGNTYTINGGVIYTNFTDACIELAYMGYAVDHEGYPMIPDLESVKLCIENYIKYKHYLIIWELGKLPDKVLQRAEQEYSFYVGQATNKLNMPNIDRMEEMTNMLRRLIPANNSYSSYFKEGTQPERIKKY